MHPKVHITLPFFAFLLMLVACSPKTNQKMISSNDKIVKDIMVLSSDDMEGREIGTIGEQKAAEYIMKRFKEIGLEPAGDNNTYYQHFTRKMNKNPHGDDNGTGPDVAGKNVVGYLNNNAATTVVIGGHYDHLGYGKEGSLHTGEMAIHNGADDNSSGVAGVLFLAETIKKANLTNNNYIFICFSGEEKGLWGSNYFVKNTTYSSKFNYMVNMDMIGRLNDDRKLAISGVGTAPIFESVIDGISSPKFNIKKELSGMGPSDHASFYNAEVPVLAFFTGQHSDYHKPSDDHQFINYSGIRDILTYIYSVVTTLDGKGKLSFIKTKDETQTRSAFAVTMGVMPDYMFDGKGMKIDGTKDGKPAHLAGLQKGDIVIKMGDMEVTDMQTYMKCLSSFKPGQTIPVVVLREGKEVLKQVTF